VDNITRKDADDVLTDCTKFVRESAKERLQVSLNLEIFWDVTQRIVVNSLPTFRDNLSVPSWISWPFNMGPIRCPETSVRN